MRPVTIWTKRFLCVAAATIGVACLIACGDGPAEGPPSVVSRLEKSCVPNQTVVCLCGIVTGRQTCSEDGVLRPCACAGEPETRQSPTPPPASDPKSPAKATCGNGVVEEGEACDDGNASNDDGCSTRCEPDGWPDAAEQCPGQPATLWKSAEVVLSGSTQGYWRDLGLSCTKSMGPDRIYLLQPTADGLVTIDATFGVNFNAVVELREGLCTSALSAAFCTETYAFPFKNVVEVRKGVKYHLIISGVTAADAGAYSLRLKLE